jgi:hypothetical protein
MPERPTSPPPHTIAIGLEFVDADPRHPDPATTGAMARRAVDALRAEGYTIQPAYTGTKGGEWFDIIRQGVQMIQDNRELLTALVSLATPIITYFFQRRASQERASQPTSTLVTVNSVEVVIENQPIEICVEETADVDRLVMRLVQAYPHLIQTVRPSGTLQVRVRVPPRVQESL